MTEPSLPEGEHYRSSTVLPAGYSDTVLRAIPCNPQRLFVYWEFPAHLDRATSLVLRLSESSRPSEEGGETTAAEIEVSPRTNAQYVNVPIPGLAYTIELVGVDADGSRQKLISTQQNVPRALPSGQPEFVTFRSNAVCGEDGADGTKEHVRTFPEQADELTKRGHESKESGQKSARPDKRSAGSDQRSTGSDQRSTGSDQRSTGPSRKSADKKRIPKGPVVSPRVDPRLLSTSSWSLPGATAL